MFGLQLLLLLRFGRECFSCGMNDEIFLSFWHRYQCVNMPLVWDGINVMLISKTQVIFASLVDNSLSGVNLLMLITPRASDTDCDEISIACCYVTSLSSVCAFLCTV